MLRNINKIAVIIFIVTIFTGCKDHNEANLFELSNEVILTVENNQECLDIFKNGFGVDSIETKKYHYVEALTSRFIKKNEGTKYQSFVLVKLNESGEVPNSITLTIGKLANGNGVITKYVSKKNDIKGVSKVISDFDKFYKKLGNQASETARLNTSLLVIDFKSNTSCSCKLYDLSFSQGEDIKNLSFFD